MCFDIYDKFCNLTPPQKARDLTLEAARDASALRKPASSSIPTAQLRKLLDSRNEREVLEGLRRVITVCAHSVFLPKPTPSLDPNGKANT